ncbi:MAG: DUF4956 domain-containing protein [Acetatifactor sp.]|nr:DUF4956 domain-containing protein [Acetatifactor sp.]
MLNIFSGIFDNSTMTVISTGAFLLCICVSLIIGLILSLSFGYKNRYSRSFLVTLAMLPAVVCVVIMMVNGNVGAGVAVAGAFSLIRFRSAPGTAKEIGAVFIAMGAGLMSGMGYLGYAVLFTLIMCVVMIVLDQTGFGAGKSIEKERVLQITIPEDLNYNDVFDEILDEYADKWELTNVKTTNMGSLFKLTYKIVEKEISKEKQFMDALRTRNGNLEISMAKIDLSKESPSL